ncbi:unnamed protein product [Angiostrongylus costaricensis]|uniref:Aminopeptidase N n=1 Tax=Angiostrongylus costaricensis TaxID=334426 RepID=A0A158PJV3_ANGCS|nr:unnamed protein product [Angiostrongylus costaricensis]
MEEFTDLVALDDFSAGAMENWGMMTFRDSLLLYTDGVTSASSKEYIALVICHEVSHQWFGNLVTMDWWDDLWLNEGFASYMEFRCVDRLFPEWNIMTKFYAENVVSSQQLDGLRSSRAISSPNSEETNIHELFDVLSYEKGSAIIRLVESLAGETMFKRSLIEYLNKYAYANAKGSHLWEIVQKYTELPRGISIQDVANAYIKKVGCPEIFVTLSDTEVTVHNQTRFFFDDGLRANTRWPIPIRYRTDDGTESQLQWMKVHENKVSWRLKKSAKWVVANTNGLSYVKVRYDAKNYAELAKQLRTDHTVEEMDHLVWMMIDEQMRYIERLVEETPVAESFKATVIGIACRLGIRDCTKKAQVQFDEWSTSGRRPSPELFRVVLREGICQRDQDAWDSVYKAYKNAKSPTEKRDLLVAMASTTQTTLIYRFGDESLLLRSIKVMADDLSTEEELDDLRDWLKDKKAGFVTTIIGTTVIILEHNKATLSRLFDQIELNIQWRRLNEGPLQQWLKDWSKQSGGSGH